MLFGLHGFFGTFNGFLNALVYSFYYRKVLKLMFGCGSDEEEPIEEGELADVEKQNHESVENPGEGKI